MAAYYPQSRAGLRNIAGVGQVKLNRYGDAFLEIIKPYCEKHGLRELPPSTPNGKSGSAEQTADRQRSSPEIGERTRLVAEAFNDGVTLKVLMERHQVTKGTILEHLTKYVLTGNPLRKQEDLQTLTTVTNEQRMAAFRAFEELGPTMLKPIFERLNGTVNYDELKILRLLFLIHQKLDETAGPAWDGVS